MIESGDNTAKFSADNSGCGITIGNGGIWANGERIDKTYQPKSYSWEPKENITAYELAQCMPILITAMRGSPVEDAINQLPQSCKRHFREVEI